MPRDNALPHGTLTMLILRVLANQPLHGYAIAQRIHTVTREELQVEEGSLYPALQKLLMHGWVKASWTTSDSGRRVREYTITASGRKQLQSEMAEFKRVTGAIGELLDMA